MKVISALLLVAVFWSQEWKSAISDSIIHIGELLRFSLSLFLLIRGHNKALCASFWKQIGGFSLDMRCAAEITALLLIYLTPCGI